MFRVIVCLDVREGKTTKGIRFQDNIDIGDPVTMAQEYYNAGADELVFYDITASAEDRGIMIDVVERVAENIFIPFSVGGGIGSVEAMHRVLMAGAEKVSINTHAVYDPELIGNAADRFGSQCVVLGMDALADKDMPSGYRVVTHGGRRASKLDALEWAQQAEKLGAGEIVLNSIDADGTKEGYELRLTRTISQAVGIPVVASGGAGTPEHLLRCYTEGQADAALVASMVHYREYSITDIKRYLSGNDVSVRLDY